MMATCTLGLLTTCESGLLSITLDMCDQPEVEYRLLSSTTKPMLQKRTHDYESLSSSDTHVRLLNCEDESAIA